MSMHSREQIEEFRIKDRIELTEDMESLGLVQEEDYTIRNYGPNDDRATFWCEDRSTGLVYEFPDGKEVELAEYLAAHHLAEGETLLHVSVGWEYGMVGGFSDFYDSNGIHTEHINLHGAHFIR